MNNKHVCQMLGHLGSGVNFQDFFKVFQNVQGTLKSIQTDLWAVEAERFTMSCKAKVKVKFNQHLTNMLEISYMFNHELYV